MSILKKIFITRVWDFPGFLNQRTVSNAFEFQSVVDYLFARSQHLNFEQQLKLSMMDK